MNDKIQSVKDHISRNKTIYISTGISIAIAGITCAIMRSNIARGVMDGSDARGVSANIASHNFLNKSTINVTTVLDREGSGHPGWPVRNLETKQIFFSQKEASNYFDVPESVLSGHLKGKFPDVDGLHFERVSLG
jgi:hypothetical protein